MIACFIGHRDVPKTNELKQSILQTVVELLMQGYDTFLFGSRSSFDDLCWEVVTELRNTAPNIKRVFVRAEYEFIDDNYKEYLLQSYEDTFFPAQLSKAGKFSYVERNQLMIDASDTCVFYYNSEYSLPLKPQGKMLPPKAQRSGTKLAYEYALKKHKKTINLFQ